MRREPMIGLLLALTACPTEADVRQGGVIVCPDPERRAALVFDVKLQPQNRLPEALLDGGGLLVEDLDGDGWMDLFIPGQREQVLRWGRDGSLDQLFDLGDDTLEGLPLDFAVGATAVDVDADGDLDVYVTRWEQPNTLLRNDGDRSFTDITGTAFPGAAAIKSQSASWGDIDADGDLDLFVGSYGERVVIDVNEPAPDCSDHRPDPAQLWRNDGDGTFTDVSDTLPSEAHGYTFMSGFYDLDDDGYPELFLAHDDGLCGPSALLRNERGTFVVDADAGFARGAHDMGMAVGDLNGDALPDFLLTSWNSVSLLQSLASDGTVQWVDVADARSLTVDGAPLDRPAQAQSGQQIYGWGAELGDLDNDADLDAIGLYGFWHYYTGAGNKPLQRDAYWEQAADGTFTDRAERFGLADEGVSRGVVLADIDNDGWLDVIKHSLDDGIPLRVSRCGAEGWVRIRLQGPAPNTYGVGARIHVVANGQEHVRWITSGSTGMYTGSPLEAHVGLGDADRIERISVHWPDGVVTEVGDVASRQRLTVRRR